MPSRAHFDALLRHRLARRLMLCRAAALALGAPALTAWLGDLARVSAAQPTPTPPDAPALPAPDLTDEYLWLENLDDTAVQEYLEAENDYADAVMMPTVDLQEVLFQELMARIDRDGTTVPTVWNGFLYYQRTEEGRDYEIICRKAGDLDAPEEVILDLNEFCGQTLDLFGYHPSPDNRYFAYSLDQTGAGLFTLSVIDLESGSEVASIPASRDVVWAQDSRALYYCQQDEMTTRTVALWRHRIGDSAHDSLLYEEPSTAYWLSLATSRDRAYHFLSSKSLDICEIRALPADQPDATLTPPIVKRGDESYYALEHYGDDFLIYTNEIRTNQDLRNFRILAAPVANPDRANWREIVPERRDVVLSGFDAFAGHLVLYERQNGFSQVALRNMTTGETTRVRFLQENGEEEPVYSVGGVNRFTGGGNLDFNATRMRVAYSSFITAGSVYEIDLETGAATLLQRNVVGGGYDRDRYEMKRLFVPAQSEFMGEIEIPISLVALKEPPPDLPGGPRPMRLDGYGGFATSLDPTFVSDRFSLIDRGITYAIAHVRGGFERGWLWWDEGRYQYKENTFSDFIACAEHLIAEGFTAPDRLVLYGYSNGGLLMGVVANRRQELVRAIVAEMPVADVPGSLLRAPAGSANIGEYGEPFAYSADQNGYSPYQNVTAHDYPAMFVTAGSNDPKVPAWIPAKWVARLRDRKTDINPLLLRIEEAGHAGETGLTAFERKTALLYAFILTQLGLGQTEALPAVPLTPTPPAATKCQDVTA